MDSLVSTSTSRCGNNFCAMGWQFYTNILQGVKIPAGQKLCEKGDFRKIVQVVSRPIFVVATFRLLRSKVTGIMGNSRGAQVISIIVNILEVGVVAV